jgi:hypothetical protein
MSSGAVALQGEAAEVALGEAQAVLSMVQEPERRDRLASLVAAIGEGEVAGADAEALEELLELGLQTGRLRALYGPGSEQSALRLYRRLPRGRELTESAGAVRGALASLAGRRLESVDVQAVGPGAFLVSIVAEGFALSIRLDRQGVRVTSIGV